MKRKKNRGKGRTGNKTAGLDAERMEAVKSAAESLAEAEGMEIVCFEFHNEYGGTTLRIFIDRPGGVTVDNCSYISRQMSDILDVKFEIDFPYRLEVSSPGLDRPLSKEKDFDKFKGNTVKIKVMKPIDGQKNFKGVLNGIFDGSVKLMVNDREISILHKEISKARLVNLNGDN